jgi:hypothetical protein
MWLNELKMNAEDCPIFHFRDMRSADIGKNRKGCISKFRNRFLKTMGALSVKRFEKRDSEMHPRETLSKGKLEA